MMDSTLINRLECVIFTWITVQDIGSYYRKYTVRDTRHSVIFTWITVQDIRSYYSKYTVRHTRHKRTQTGSHQLYIICMSGKIDCMKTILALITPFDILKKYCKMPIH